MKTVITNFTTAQSRFNYENLLDEISPDLVRWFPKREQFLSREYSQWFYN